MTGYFRESAVDFDGTLTEGARPDDAVIDAIKEARSKGIRIILATGRILGGLRHASRTSTSTSTPSSPRTAH